MLLRLLFGLLGLVVGMAALLFVAGQAGFLKRQAPSDLGVRDGRLKPPSATENSVSSQAYLYPDLPTTTYARIDVLPATGDRAATMGKLRDIVQSLEGAAIVTEQPDYLHVAFTTRWMKFVDDAEFWFDPAIGAVQVRSAARLGRRDMGVNRARIEVIRGLMAAP